MPTRYTKDLCFIVYKKTQPDPVFQEEEEEEEDTK